MLRRTWMMVGLVLALIVPATSRSEAPRAFVNLRDKAQPLESLAAFLGRYVGACSDLLEKVECENKAKKARAELTNKLFYVILDESSSRMLKAGAYNPNTREFTFELTPFFESAGLGLTDGAPKGQDANGNPRIQIVPVVAKLPYEAMPMDYERLIRTQNLKVHLIFKPLGLWSMQGKGGKLEGVRSKFLAVRLTNARSGEDVALRVSE